MPVLIDGQTTVVDLSMSKKDGTRFFPKGAKEEERSRRAGCSLGLKGKDSDEKLINKIWMDNKYP